MRPEPSATHREEITALIAGEIDAVCIESDEAASAEPPSSHHSGLIFPGSFNPLHTGHLQMAQIAAARLARRVEFEISITNVDKPPLDAETIIHRIHQFDAGHPVWITRAARFTQKAELFAGATFVVGADTIGRIGDARYYDSARQAAGAVDEMAGRECRFLVFGRDLGGGFVDSDQAALPSELARLCEWVSEAEFRLDVSSTDLREG